MLRFEDGICWCCYSAVLCNLIYKWAKASFLLFSYCFSPWSISPASLPPFPSLTIWKPGTAGRETEAVRSSGFRTPPPPRRQGPGAGLAGAPPGASQGAAGEGARSAGWASAPSQLLWTQGRQALTSASPQRCGGLGVLCPKGEGVALSYPPHPTPPALLTALSSRVETVSCVPLGDSGTLSQVTQPPFSAVLENTLFDHQSFRLSLWGTVAHSGPVSLSCNVGQLLKRLPDLSFFFFFFCSDNCKSCW